MDLQTLRTRYRHDILRLASEHKLKNIRVFGSVVRGDANEDSDVDLLVGSQKGCSLLDMVGFENDATQLLGAKVDLVDDNAVHPRLAPYIFAEAQAL